MANEIALTTADKVEVVASVEQDTAPALESITAGAPVRYDPTLGTFRNGNGSDMTEGKIWGIATRTVAAGEALTVIRRGKMSGWDFSGLSYGATIYASDTDARISGTAGTKAVTLGYLSGGFSELRGVSPVLIFTVNISLAAAIT